MNELPPVLVTYATWIVGVLGVAGIAQLVLKFGLKKDIAGIFRTYSGWLLMIPVILCTLALGRVTTVVGIYCLSLFGFREFARATGLESERWYRGLVYLAIAALCAITLVSDPNTGKEGWYGLFMAFPAYAIALLLIVPVLKDRSEGQLQPVALAIVGVVYLGWMFGHLAFLANSEHFYGYVLFLLFAVELNDVSAFTFGKLFGRRKLRPRVSPNKTLEGALGALLVSMALPWLLRFSFPHFKTAELLLTGLIVGLGGQLGDLTISFIKRDVGVKDMGTTIPGHGGILDRVDSLIYVAPLFFHMVRWFHGV